MFDEKTALSLDEAMALLSARGVETVEIDFSGGNDEGFAESARLQGPEGQGLGEIKDWYCGGYSYSGGQWVPISEPETDDEKLYQFLVRPIYDRYGSFAGEFQVDGTLTWRVSEKRSSMHGQESTMQDFEY